LYVYCPRNTFLLVGFASLPDHDVDFYLVMYLRPVYLGLVVRHNLWIFHTPRFHTRCLHYFFFQAEDGIRDRNVTGVQTCALPIFTHHNTLNMDMVLRIETELYLKRLVVGGRDRVYEVGRIFRNEGMDPKHNPEFTTIELYQAFTDYHGMMDLVEELYKRLAEKICGSLVIPYQGKQIDMGHWERLTMVEAVKKYSGVDYHDWKTDSDAITAAKAHNVDLPEVPTRGTILAAFFDAFVEDKLIQPTFIYDYPVEISPLAKRKPEDPAFTERADLHRVIVDEGGLD